MPNHIGLGELLHERAAYDQRAYKPQTLLSCRQLRVGDRGPQVQVIDVDTRADVACDVLFRVIVARQRMGAPSTTGDFRLRVIRACARPSGAVYSRFFSAVESQFAS